MTIYQRRLDQCGGEFNFEKTQEEAGELIAAISRFRNSEAFAMELINAIAEEAADLWICLEILQLQLGPAFSQALDAKLDRLAKRCEAKEAPEP